MNKNTNEISEKDRAYFAGFFDGEGCVSIDNSSGYCLSVDFNHTYAAVLYEMKRLFGGSVCKKDMEKFKNCQSIQKRVEFEGCNIESYKQTYTFHLRGKEAWIFLKIIEPDSREKKEQVRTGIEFFQGKRDGRGCGLSKSQIERSEYYYKKLQELKKYSNEKNDDILEFKDSQQTLSFCSER